MHGFDHSDTHIGQFLHIVICLHLWHRWNPSNCPRMFSVSQSELRNCRVENVQNRTQERRWEEDGKSPGKQSWVAVDVDGPACDDDRSSTSAHRVWNKTSRRVLYILMVLVNVWRSHSMRFFIVPHTTMYVWSNHCTKQIKWDVTAPPTGLETVLHEQNERNVPLNSKNATMWQPHLCFCVKLPAWVTNQRLSVCNFTWLVPAQLARNRYGSGSQKVPATRFYRKWKHNKAG